MKKFTVILLFMAIATASVGQHTTTREDYLMKSKRQKSTGLMLLLGGTGCVFLGSVGVVIVTKSLVAGVIVMGVGLIAVPASIPFFIAASRNKKTGMSLSFKNETAPQLQIGSFTNRPVPSLSLKISL